GKLKTTLEEKIFNKAMQTLARNLLLPSAGVPEFNTRTKPEDIFQKTFKHDSELRMLVSTGSGGKTTKTQLKAKADNFFESLDCPISDNQLIILSKEIKNIDYRFYKTSASFLLRAILERTLDWCVAEKKLIKSSENTLTPNAMFHRVLSLAWKLKSIFVLKSTIKYFPATLEAVCSTGRAQRRFLILWFMVSGQMQVFQCLKTRLVLLGRLYSWFFLGLH